jgi:putative MATE family efflux protein
MSRSFRRFGPLNFYREALGIALPVMLQQLIMSMVSLIDNFMVAGLGDTSMAAVNVSNQIFFVFIVMVNILCQAGGIYLAQFKGSGDSTGMRNAYRFKVLITLAAAALVFVLFWAIPEGLVSMLTMGNSSQEEIVPKGALYIRLISFTLGPMVISSAIGTSFREIGRPAVPLVISAAATVINTVGNWILIYGNLGVPRMEISGAAIATIIARCCEAAAYIVYVNRKKINFYSPFRRLLAVDWSLVRKILSKSVMMFISEISWITSETVMVALYNGRGGAETVAGMAAGWTIANIFMLLFGGIWTTAAVLVGGSLGAEKLEEARKRGAWIQSGAFVAGIFIAVVGIVISLLMVPLVFANLTLPARRIAIGLITAILCYFPIWAVLNAQFAICRSGGDTLMGLYTDGFVNFGGVIPGAFLLAVFTSIGPVGMFVILKLTDFIKYFIARYFYNKERWVKNLTV